MTTEHFLTLEEAELKADHYYEYQEGVFKYEEDGKLFKKG